jgi:hypothetical protein
MRQSDDVASKLALLQADIEQLRFELGLQRKECAKLEQKVAALSQGLSESRAEADALCRKVSELRLFAERSAAQLRALEPERLAPEVSRLSDAVARLRDSLRRHEAEGKKPA